MGSSKNELSKTTITGAPQMNTHLLCGGLVKIVLTAFWASKKGNLPQTDR